MKIVNHYCFVILAIFNLVSCQTQTELKLDKGAADPSSQVPSFTCPSGYVKVPANSDVGVSSDFCVMQFEAKDDGSGNPISQADTTPWVNITNLVAQSECRSLNALNGVTNKYDLISNPEWMAIARNVEGVNSNWSGGSPGIGCMKMGNFDGRFLSECDPTVNSYYRNMAVDFGSSRLDNGSAQFELSNGNIIWDLAGNVAEFVDWTLNDDSSYMVDLTDRAYKTSDGAPTTTITEYNEAYTFTAVMPDSSFLPDDITLDFNFGIGRFYNYAFASRGNPIRGAFWGAQKEGIYSLNFVAPDTQSNGNIGFRCVYRE